MGLCNLVIEPKRDMRSGSPQSEPSSGEGEQETVFEKVSHTRDGFPCLLITLKVCALASSVQNTPTHRYGCFGEWMFLVVVGPRPFAAGITPIHATVL
jgi:hypothetical protein